LCITDFARLLDMRSAKSDLVKTIWLQWLRRFWMYNCGTNRGLQSYARHQSTLFGAAAKNSAINWTKPSPIRLQLTRMSDNVKYETKMFTVEYIL
jgi:hypothetical protein